jgi:hypothetical protein
MMDILYNNIMLNLRLRLRLILRLRLKYLLNLNQFYIFMIIKLNKKE